MKLKFNELTILTQKKEICEKLEKFFLDNYAKLLPLIKMSPIFGETDQESETLCEIQILNEAVRYSFDILKEYSFDIAKEAKKDFVIDIITAKINFVAFSLSPEELLEELFSLEQEDFDKFQVVIFDDDDNLLRVSISDHTENDHFLFTYLKYETEVYMQILPSSLKYEKIFDEASKNIDKGYLLIENLIKKSFDKQKISKESRLINFILESLQA